MLRKVIFTLLFVALAVMTSTLVRRTSKSRCFSDLTEYGLTMDEERALVVSMFNNADPQSAQRLARYYELDLPNGSCKAAACMLISALAEDPIGRHNWDVMKKRNLDAIVNARLTGDATDDSHELLLRYIEFLQAWLLGDDAHMTKRRATFIEFGVNQKILDSDKLAEHLRQ